MPRTTTRPPVRAKCGLPPSFWSTSLILPAAGVAGAGAGAVTGTLVTGAAAEAREGSAAMQVRAARAAAGRQIVFMETILRDRKGNSCRRRDQASSLAGGGDQPKP